MIENKIREKILLVFGTRPEAIKMAPLVKELQKHAEKFETVICVTAQHREMLDQVLQLFEIVPDFDLDIMKAGQDLYDITSRVLLGIRKVLKEVNPNIVLVHGDTSTSTAAALGAFYAQIPVGHIEAGLRTKNIYSPWPEEMNRQLTSRIAKYHFAPTTLNKKNLLEEGIREENICVTGNTVVDALFWVVDKIKSKSVISEEIIKLLQSEGIRKEAIDSWISQNRKLVLITGHRRENFGQGFLNVCEAIKNLSISLPSVDFIYPMHLNPNVRKAITDVFGEARNRTQSNVYFIEPLDYLPFIFLMELCYIILTDSGGIQEEAPALGKPVLVMRENTERPEALEAGTVKLVGTKKELIIEEVSKLVNDKQAYDLMGRINNPYGNGSACKIIVENLPY